MAYDPIITPILISTIITLIIFILGNVYSIKLRALEYEIIRITYLLENCYGVLKAAFDRVRSEFISKSTGRLDRALSSKPDNYDKVSMIYNQFYFEINKVDEELAKMISFFIDEIIRDKVKEIVYLKKVSKLGTAIEEDPINEKIVENINIALETRFNDWIAFLRNRIDSISEKYSTNLKEYIEVRKHFWKIVKLPFLKFDQEFVNQKKEGEGNTKQKETGS